VHHERGWRMNEFITVEKVFIDFFQACQNFIDGQKEIEIHEKVSREYWAQIEQNRINNLKK
jgi:hypothetical protein